uniref:histidine kinase n=1 Tax=freshwater metagenome TaxID=449393 RepID=A0A6J5ZS77_9ZZZZ
MLVLAVVALVVPLAVSLRDRVDAEVRLEARSEAEAVASRAVSVINPPDSTRLQSLADTAALAVGGRVVIVDSKGRILADSDRAALAGASFANRPEIATALGGGVSQVRRYSTTLGSEILATAVPVYTGTKPGGAVRVTQSVSSVSSAIRRAWLGLALIGALVIALGLIAGAIIAKRITSPIVRLDEAARRVAGGDLTATAKVEGSTEQRALAASFNTMTARLAQLLGSQREFVADASHQLRTPLAGMRLRLEEARALGADPEQREELDAAIGEVDRLALIVNELLELSRAGEGKPPTATTDSVAALGGTWERWRAAAQGEGCDLELGEVDAVQFACHRSDVDRMLDAVIENALAYAPGKPIVLSCRGGVISVCDNGAGLRGEAGEDLFERFRRGDAGRTGPPGTGLGLSIVRELARRWGGEVEIRDRADGGAEVTISLPLADSDSLPGLSNPLPRIES